MFSKRPASGRLPDHDRRRAIRGTGDGSRRSPATLPDMRESPDRSGNTKKQDAGAYLRSRLIALAEGSRVRAGLAGAVKSVPGEGGTSRTRLPDGAGMSAVGRGFGASRQRMKRAADIAAVRAGYGQIGSEPRSSSSSPFLFDLAGPPDRERHWLKERIEAPTVTARASGCTRRFSRRSGRGAGSHARRAPFAPGPPSGAFVPRYVVPRAARSA